jgi:hypothetical protein
MEGTGNNKQNRLTCVSAEQPATRRRGATGPSRARRPAHPQERRGQDPRGRSRSGQSPAPKTKPTKKIARRPARATKAKDRKRVALGHPPAPPPPGRAGSSHQAHRRACKRRCRTVPHSQRCRPRPQTLTYAPAPVRPKYAELRAGIGATASPKLPASVPTRELRNRHRRASKRLWPPNAQIRPSLGTAPPLMEQKSITGRLPAGTEMTKVSSHPWRPEQKTEQSELPPVAVQKTG